MTSLFTVATTRLTTTFRSGGRNRAYDLGFRSGYASSFPHADGVYIACVVVVTVHGGVEVIRTDSRRIGP